MFVEINKCSLFVKNVHVYNYVTLNDKYMIFFMLYVTPFVVYSMSSVELEMDPDIQFP